MWNLDIFIPGACGFCSISGTTIECNDQFHNKPLTLKIATESCKNPVKVKIDLKIIGLIFSKEIVGDQDIPLPGISILNFKIFSLNVNAKALDNGNLQIKVRLCNCALHKIWQNKGFFYLHFPCKDRIFDSVLIFKKKWNILCSDLSPFFFFF